MYIQKFCKKKIWKVKVKILIFVLAVGHKSFEQTDTGRCHFIVHVAITKKDDVKCDLNCGRLIGFGGRGDGETNKENIRYQTGINKFRNCVFSL